MAVIAICQLSGNLCELVITPLPDSYCLIEADNNTDSRSTLTVFGNLSRSCDLHINPLSSSQILISVVARNITSTDYLYIERMGQLGACSNRYVALMELQQQPCKVNFNATIQLHFRGDVTVGIQDAMVEDHHLECSEDVNQEEMVGVLEGQTLNCKQVKGFGSVIQCVRTNHQWWGLDEKWWEWSSKSSSGCNVQCPKNCSCILTDRQVVYSCSQNNQDFGKTSSGFLLFPSDISHLDLSSIGIGGLTVKTFMSIGKDISYLDLSFNFLTILPIGSLDYLYNIIHINLNENSLVTLGTDLFSNLHNLRVLTLSSNSLVTLDVAVFSSLHSLTRLCIYNNSLVKLDVGLFAILHNLIFLALDHNALDTLNMHICINLHKLNRLYLTDNKLVALDHRTFHKLIELRYLYLNKNKINHLKDGTFSNLFLLKRLSVACNRLTFLSFNIFENLHSLVQLDLSGNRLQTIPRIGHLELLSRIDLIGNPLAKITKNMFSGIGSNASIYVDKPEVCLCYYLNGSDTCYNTIKPSPYLTCNQLLSLTALSVFIWIIGCSAIFGNIFVVWWKRFKQKAENKVQSLLLSNLAMSDLLMGIYMIIIASADVYYGEYFPMNAESWRSSILCRIAGTLAITSSEASVLFVTFISIDRCITIKFPYSIHKLRVKSARLISALVWAFSLTLGLTASILAGRNSDFYDNSHVCIGLPLAQVIHPKTQTVKVLEVANIEYFENWKFEKSIEVVESFGQSPGLYFSVAVFIAFNMFCFLLILTCYIGLIRAVSKTSSEAFRQREMAEEIRMTLKVSAIVLTDFFCWFPICLMGALVQVGVIKLPNSVFAWVVTFVLPINSAINPFLYTIATVITDRCSRRTPNVAHIWMETQAKRIQRTEDIPERVGKQHAAPLAELENTTCL